METPRLPDDWFEEFADDELLTDVDEAELATIYLARRDPATCAEYILRDEETGAPIWNAESHDEWHDLATRNRRLVLMAHVESGKSQHLTIARVIYELGTNPRARVLILSKSKEKAVKFTASIKRHIESNPAVRRVFPHLRPGLIWRADRFRIDQGQGGWTGDSKDYSVEAAGLDSDILGGRYAHVIADDVLDWENTFTEYQCEKVYGVLKGVVGGRITRHGAFWLICNTWREEDAAHRFGRMKGWYLHRASVERPDGTLTWEERWDRERIQDFEDAYGKDEADRQLRCITPDLAGRHFKSEWIYRCMEAGAGLTYPFELYPDDIPPGAFTVCGVDLASRKGKKSDRTVFFVILVHPPEPGKTRGRLQLLWVHSGRMEAPEILEALVDIYERYGCWFLVEDSGAQDYLRQLLTMVRPEIPVAAFGTTASSKWRPDYGIGGLKAEFSGGWWIIPTIRQPDGTLALPDSDVGRYVQAWIDGLRRFDPSAHTPDEVMASWFAREGGRRPRFRHQVDNAGAAAPTAAGPAASPKQLQDELLWDDLRGSFGGPTR